MKNIIKSILFVFFFIVNGMFFKNIEAHLIDLQDFQERPAHILRALLKAVDDTGYQLCHLNNPHHRLYLPYLVFDKPISVKLPSKKEENKIQMINCLYMQRFPCDESVEVPHDNMTVLDFLSDLEDTTFVPVKIDHNAEIIVFTIGADIGQIPYLYKIILNIDPEESKKIRRSTLTSTLHRSNISDIGVADYPFETRSIGRSQSLDSNQIMDPLLKSYFQQHKNLSILRPTLSDTGQIRWGDIDDFFQVPLMTNTFEDCFNVPHNTPNRTPEHESNDDFELIFEEIKILSPIHSDTSSEDE